MRKDRPARGLVTRPWRFRATFRQHGVSLLEVLVAVLVLVVGVLGAVSLQTNALRYNASAAHNTQASFLAYDMLDRMRANTDNLASYAISVSAGCTAAASGSSILATDRQDFAHAVSCLLPDGYGSVAINGNRATVTIGWSEDRIVASAGNTEFVVSSMIRGDL
ncbi:type IV pilus assembly protein PilV [Halopseudomonas litoralis]|uniref:Type IV pilus assembly protein PilV n=1 Tax=Halopseudomonas litoralis TaxID=797277 RepID=A0A1H1L918_9GAMM|nr:type IV pilus modification protein PilV [Halopseudomonas litoralis]SDR70973.1 type IV pilus assembly protein PilV [Halopseudomonas litoralis]